MNWGEYREKLKTWAKMADDSDVPWDDCMDLAHDTVSREVRFQSLDETYTFDTDQAQQLDNMVYAHVLPEDYQGVWRLTNNGLRVRRYQPDVLSERHGRTASGTDNRPYMYAVVGSRLRTSPGAGGDLRLIYHRRDEKPASDDETNTGLTEAWSLYLWAGLFAVHEFTRDDIEADRALGKYEGLRDRVNASEENKRHSGAGRAG